LSKQRDLADAKAPLCWRVARMLAASALEYPAAVRARGDSPKRAAAADRCLVRRIEGESAEPVVEIPEAGGVGCSQRRERRANSAVSMSGSWCAELGGGIMTRERGICK